MDIRNVGSGNAGGTNALRTQGKTFAAWVMLIDVGKGILAVTVLPVLEIPGIGIDLTMPRELIIYATAFGAIVGHVFPVWYEFRGGKGGATAAGLLCFLAPPLAIPIIGMWLAVIFVTGYVGLATIGASVAAAVYAGVVGTARGTGFFYFSSAVALMIIYTHRGNIVRMWNGAESRFGRYFGLK